jgi:hypothetical protein
MRTLWDDGLDKVAAGLTTVEELARVVVELRRAGGTPRRRSPKRGWPALGDAPMTSRHTNLLPLIDKEKIAYWTVLRQRLCS